MANARLTALRLVGFKSFAEKTVVEFGPGISAVVGPNGSGKSNLADALRWTLGEQGRTLRTRRSEDVIFAGSSSRRAVGMADVTLVIDNGDRLLPVDYGEVEIGRRLYRSGESEYLLNRQRIRLRDLVELLDAGNLADNAFLFIGQGMVDQALALRPEERRPLFEEAAGVRRHERRRRHAEAELVEAEANLDRLRDVLAELRPQARRLAAQAEQLQARRSAGIELAEGLLAAARARWIASSDTAAKQQREVERARAAADTALAALKNAEDEAATLSAEIAQRADAERTQRDALDRQRAELTELRVAVARTESEIAAAERDRTRLASDLGASEARIADAARVLASLPVASGPYDDSELAIVERQLAELEPSASSTDSVAQLRARSAELDQQRRRRESVAQSQQGAQAHAAHFADRHERAEREREEAAAAAHVARNALETAEQRALSTRAHVEETAAERTAAHDRMATTERELAAAQARFEAIRAATDANDEGLVRAARARGGTLLGEDLVVEPALRGAVAAALGHAATAYLVDADAVPALADRRGTLAVRGTRAKATAANAAAQVVEAARAAGGGPLAEAIRRDPQLEVTRLLQRYVWVPQLGDALSLRAQLPSGWSVVTSAGAVVRDDGIVGLGSAESVLDLRAEASALATAVSDLAATLETERIGYERSREAAAKAVEQSQSAARAYEAARQEARRTDEAERVAQRRAEQLLREMNWEHSQAERLKADLAAADDVVTRLMGEVERLQAEVDGAAKSDGEADRSVRRLQLVARREDLRAKRDARMSEERANDEARRRAEVARAMDENRIRELEADSLRVSDVLAGLETRQAEQRAKVAAAEARADAASKALNELLSAGADERARLIAAERAATDRRERLRQAETASRQSEFAAMEARIQLDQTREQLLVELATIGADGLRVLRASSGLGNVPETDGDDDENAALAMEDLLGAVVDRWQSAGQGESEPAPSQGRLAGLRRRFNELGAGNPFAVEEYAELRDRLESLEAQRADMETAIANTRELIASLSALINDQFRSTFAALEDAFERRFHELFGGGDAELSLTAPDDLSVTGIEIHARPPGKKRQPLSMLSGGERALTAVSLLLAMLEVRQVPFCVLDEVDAALDEANVGRFARALRGLSDQTQFIVITHNRGTIEGADALYGVTIGDDAVSRVVSLRLPSAPKNGHSPAIDDELAEAALA